MTSTSMVCRLARRMAVLFAGLLLLVVPPARAQQGPVEGSVTVAGTEAPVAGAVVYLMDSSFRAVRAVLTDSAGGFRIAAPEPGSYSLRIERIGFETAQFPPFAVPQGGVRSLRPVVQVRPVEIEGLTVTAERVCNMNGDGGALLRVWSEARKALMATALSEVQGDFEFVIEVGERRLNRRLLELGAGVDTTRTTWSAAFDFVPVEQLGGAGWGRLVDGVIDEVYGPSPQILLSPWFADHHCLSLAPSADSLVGLAFASREGTFEIGIEGTFWFAQPSWLLRRIAFQFTGLPDLTDAVYEGGEIELRAEAAGFWYVDSWRILVPTWRARAGGLLGGGGQELTGYVETAGRVLERRRAPQR